MIILINKNLLKSILKIHINGTTGKLQMLMDLTTTTKMLTF